MSKKPSVPVEEQYRLIMECRQSGLSDYRWCMNHDIRPGNFYNWVARLRKKGFDIPVPAGADNYLPDEHQDVVKVDITPETPFIQTIQPLENKNAYSVNPLNVMTLEINGACLSITNNADPVLIAQIVQLLRGLSC